jgi:hypothetical protein
MVDGEYDRRLIQSPIRPEAYSPHPCPFKRPNSRYLHNAACQEQRFALAHKVGENHIPGQPFKRFAPKERWTDECLQFRNSGPNDALLDEHGKEKFVNPVEYKPVFSSFARASLDDQTKPTLNPKELITLSQYNDNDQNAVVGKASAAVVAKYALERRAAVKRRAVGYIPPIPLGIEASVTEISIPVSASGLMPMLPSPNQTSETLRSVKYTATEDFRTASPRSSIRSGGFLSIHMTPQTARGNNTTTSTYVPRAATPGSQTAR